MQKLQACLPIAFSAQGEIEVAMRCTGELLEVDYDNLRSRSITDDICTHCRLLTIQYDTDGPMVQMVGQWRDWVIYRPHQQKIIFQSCMEALEDAEVAAVKPWRDELVLIATYPNQSPTELVLYNKQHHVQKILNLGFRYKPSAALALSLTTDLGACSYGENGQDIAVVDFRTNAVITILHGHILGVESCCFIESHDLLVSGAQDGTVRLWQISPGRFGRLLQTLEGNFSQVQDIRWSPKYSVLIVLCSRRSGIVHEIIPGVKEPVPESVLYVWNISGGAPKSTACGPWHKHRANAFVVSPDGETVITGHAPTWKLSPDDEYNNLRFWALKTLVP